MKSPIFGLIDCNNFYVSCERVFRPDLNNVPVIVMSNNDGCAIARSEEVKLLGIKMGQPIHEIRDLINQYDIKLLSPNFDLYSDMSNRVMAVLSDMVSKVEVYSVDECFLDFSDFDLKDIKIYAEHINYEVCRQTGIPTCLGISCTKTLAKAANRYAKKTRSTGGLFIFNCENIPEVFPLFLKDLKSSDIWGIGRSFGKWLKTKSIHTAYEFYEMDSAVVLSKMKSVGLKTWYELHGISCLDINEIFEPKKNIATTRTFRHTLSDFKEISQAVSSYASACAEKLREQDSVCSVVTLFVVSRDSFEAKSSKHFRENEHFCSYSFSMESATSFSPDIVGAALFCLKNVYKNFLEYKRAGVILSCIEQKDKVQISFKTDFNSTIENNNLMLAIDFINHKYGTNKIKLASSIFDEHLYSYCEKKSPNYTTAWNDILEIF